MLLDLDEESPTELDVVFPEDLNIMSPTYSVKSPISSVASSEGSIMSPVVIGKDSLKEKRVKRLAKVRETRKKSLVYYRENPRRSSRLSSLY